MHRLLVADNMTASHYKSLTPLNATPAGCMHARLIVFGLICEFHRKLLTRLRGTFSTLHNNNNNNMIKYTSIMNSPLL